MCVLLLEISVSFDQNVLGLVKLCFEISESRCNKLLLKVAVKKMMVSLRHSLNFNLLSNADLNNKNDFRNEMEKFTFTYTSSAQTKVNFLLCMMISINFCHGHLIRTSGDANV